MEKSFHITVEINVMDGGCVVIYEFNMSFKGIFFIVAAQVARKCRC